MPFQDEDETATTAVPRSPSALERFLRKLFFEDRGLKLLALAITLVLWFGVAGQNEPITKTTTVQLNLVHPPNLDISNDPPRTIEVVLTGSRQRIEPIRALDLIATVDVSKLQAGERVLRLSNETVQMEVPDGVKIESFKPWTFPLKLEPHVERLLGIEIKLEGRPADGYEVYGAHPSRDTVRVQGPASHVNALRKAPTETISIDGKNATLTVPSVAINIPDQKVEVEDPVVDVTVEIGERRVEAKPLERRK